MPTVRSIVVVLFCCASIAFAFPAFSPVVTGSFSNGNARDAGDTSAFQYCTSSTPCPSDASTAPIQFRYGDGASGQEIIGFKPRGSNAAQVTAAGQLFFVGQAVQINWPIRSTTGAGGVRLTINVARGSSVGSFPFELVIDSTRDVCAGLGCPNEAGGSIWWSQHPTAAIDSRCVVTDVTTSGIIVRQIGADACCRYYGVANPCTDMITLLAPKALESGLTPLTLDGVAHELWLDGFRPSGLSGTQNFFMGQESQNPASPVEMWGRLVTRCPAASSCDLSCPGCVYPAVGSRSLDIDWAALPNHPAWDFGHQQFLCGYSYWEILVLGRGGSTAWKDLAKQFAGAHLNVIKRPGCTEPTDSGVRSAFNSALSLLRQCGAGDNTLRDRLKDFNEGKEGACPCGHQDCPPWDLGAGEAPQFFIQQDGTCSCACSSQCGIFQKQKADCSCECEAVDCGSCGSQLPIGSAPVSTGAKTEVLPCQCLCDDNCCPGNTVASGSSCSCQCPQCPAGQRPDPNSGANCNCACPSCNPGEILLDAVTCQCGCPDNQCVPPQILDSEDEFCFQCREDPSVYARFHSIIDEDAGTLTIRATYSPNFVDNTYGINSVGWGGRGHTFGDLVGSDHIEMGLADANGAEVWRAKIDYIAVVGGEYTTGCVSRDGGQSDGSMITGDASSVVGCRTSLTENFRTDINCDLSLQAKVLYSPETDGLYTPNINCPDWDFLVWYEVTVRLDIFGSAGFGRPLIDFIHASPSKISTSTCTLDQTFCGTIYPDGCVCSCPADWCDGQGNTVADVSDPNCECKCPAAADICPLGAEIDPDSGNECACRCPLCPGNQVSTEGADGSCSTCACPACPQGQTSSGGAACTCVCPSSGCAAGETNVKVGAVCECRCPQCPPRRVRQNNVCANPCICDETRCAGDLEIVDQSLCTCGCPADFCDGRADGKTQLDTSVSGECSCVCPDTCSSQGLELDETTCGCVCPPCANPDKVADPLNSCQCSCPAELCPAANEKPASNCDCVCVSCAEQTGNSAIAWIQNGDCSCTCPACNNPDQVVINDNTCECACPNSCTTPKTRQLVDCSCVCPSSCSSPKVQNTATCACECPTACPVGQIQDAASCACSCPAGSCSGPNQRVKPGSSSCECECILCSVQTGNTAVNWVSTGLPDCGCECPSCANANHEAIEAQNCACRCPAPNPCSGENQVQDQTTCECVCVDCANTRHEQAADCSCACPDTCPPGQTQDATTCLCSCPTACNPGFELDPTKNDCSCREIPATCPAGELCVPTEAQPDNCFAGMCAAGDVCEWQFDASRTCALGTGNAIVPSGHDTSCYTAVCTGGSCNEVALSGRTCSSLTPASGPGNCAGGACCNQAVCVGGECKWQFRAGSTCTLADYEADSGVTLGAAAACYRPVCREIAATGAGRCQVSFVAGATCSADAAGREEACYSSQCVDTRTTTGIENACTSQTLEGTACDATVGVCFDAQCDVNGQCSGVAVPGRACQLNDAQIAQAVATLNGGDEIDAECYEPICTEAGCGVQFAGGGGSCSRGVDPCNRAVCRLVNGNGRCVPEFRSSLNCRMSDTGITLADAAGCYSPACRDTDSDGVGECVAIFNDRTCTADLPADYEPFCYNSQCVDFTNGVPLENGESAAPGCRPEFNPSGDCSGFNIAAAVGSGRDAVCFASRCDSTARGCVAFYDTNRDGTSCTLTQQNIRNRLGGDATLADASCYTSVCAPDGGAPSLSLSGGCTPLFRADNRECDGDLSDVAAVDRQCYETRCGTDADGNQGCVRFFNGGTPCVPEGDLDTVCFEALCVADASNPEHAGTCEVTAREGDSCNFDLVAAFPDPVVEQCYRAECLADGSCGAAFQSGASCVLPGIADCHRAECTQGPGGPSDLGCFAVPEDSLSCDVDSVTADISAEDAHCAVTQCVAGECQVGYDPNRFCTIDFTTYAGGTYDLSDRQCVSSVCTDSGCEITNAPDGSECSRNLNAVVGVASTSCFTVGCFEGRCVASFNSERQCALNGVSTCETAQCVADPTAPFGGACVSVPNPEAATCSQDLSLLYPGQEECYENTCVDGKCEAVFVSGGSCIPDTAPPGTAQCYSGECSQLPEQACIWVPRPFQPCSDGLACTYNNDTLDEITGLPTDYCINNPENNALMCTGFDNPCFVPEDIAIDEARDRGQKRIKNCELNSTCYETTVGRVCVDPCIVLGSSSDSALAAILGGLAGSAAAACFALALITACFIKFGHKVVRGILSQFVPESSEGFIQENPAYQGAGLEKFAGTYEPPGVAGGGD